jgi:hypothetical protein
MCGGSAATSCCCFDLRDFLGLESSVLDPSSASLEVESSWLFDPSANQIIIATTSATTPPTAADSGLLTKGFSSPDRIESSAGAGDVAGGGTAAIFPAGRRLGFG